MSKLKDVLIEGQCYYCKKDCTPNYYFHYACASKRFEQIQIDKAFDIAKFKQEKAKARKIRFLNNKASTNKKSNSLNHVAGKIGQPSS